MSTEFIVFALIVMGMATTDIRITNDKHIRDLFKIRTPPRKGDRPDVFRQLTPNRIYHAEYYY